MRTLAVLLLSLLCAAPAWSADVYAVATGGLSSGTCSTPETACTSTRAQSFCAGNHVWFGSGTYTTGLRCVGAGTGDADSLRSIFECSPRRTCIINGLEPTATVNAAVRLTHNYGSVRGFVILVPEVSGTANRYGLYSENVTGSEFDDNEVYYPSTSATLSANTQQWGVYVQGAGFKVTDNEIHRVNTGVNVNTDTAVPTGTVLRNTITDLSIGDAEDADCINVGVTARDSAFSLRIADNVCSGYRDDGIDLFGGSNVIAEDNTIGDPIDDVQSTNSCIKAGKNTSTGNIIRRNSCIHQLAHVPTQYGLVVNGLSSGRIEANIFKVDDIGIEIAELSAAGGDANTVVHNDAIGAGSYGILVNTGVSSATVKNNYAQGNLGDLHVTNGSTATGGNNALRNGTRTGSGTYSGTDISGAADFVGGESPTAAEGYCLKPVSALRSVGTYQGSQLKDYYDHDLGNPPNIGAMSGCFNRMASLRRAMR